LKLLWLQRALLSWKSKRKRKKFCVLQICEANSNMLFICTKK
jgi:hypothetical protein